MNNTGMTKFIELSTTLHKGVILIGLQIVWWFIGGNIISKSNFIELSVNNNLILIHKLFARDH